jgi:hypothetical protein
MQHVISGTAIAFQNRLPIPRTQSIELDNKANCHVKCGSFDNNMDVFFQCNPYIDGYEGSAWAVLRFPQTKYSHMVDIFIGRV